MKPRESVAIAVLLLAAIPTPARSQTPYTCEPSPAVKAGLDQLPAFQSLGQTEWQWEINRISEIRQNRLAGVRTTKTAKTAKRSCS
jgi:hypothetical protein